MDTEWPAIIHPYRQDALAKALGVSDGTVSNWFHSRTFPRHEQIAAIATFLRVDALELAAAIAEARKRRSLQRFAEIA